MKMPPDSIRLVLPRLLLKSGPGTGVKFSQSGKHALYGNPPRWHLVTPEKPAPKGAPMAHDPGKHATIPAQFLASDEWDQLKLPESNVNAPVYNKALAKLKEWSESGNVAAILGASYGSNTYGQKLAKIANHLLSHHGSPHKVTPGQKPGTHAAVQGGGTEPAPAFSEPPVAHYQVDPQQYGSWAFIKPGVGKSFTHEDKQALVTWFKSAGWDAKINDKGRVYVKPKDGASLDDIPFSPAEKAKLEKDKVTFAATQKAEAEKDAANKAIQSTDQFSFVEKTFGGAANAYTKKALTKYLTDGGKFEGIAGGWIDHLKQSGVDVGDGSPKAAAAGLKAAYQKASTPTTEPAPAAEDAQALKDKLQMLHDFLKEKPDSPNVPAWKAKIAEIEAKVGPLKTEVAAPAKPVVDTSSWSAPAQAAFALKQDYEALDKLDNKAVGAFKTKLRALAKKTPEDDQKATMLLDGLATKVWGTDYDPKVAGIEFAPAASAGGAAPSLALSDDEMPDYPDNLPALQMVYASKAGKAADAGDLQGVKDALASLGHKDGKAFDYITTLISKMEAKAASAATGSVPSETSPKAADPFDGLKLPDQLKEYLLKPSVTMKDGKTVSGKEFVDGLLADGYGNPEYFASAKGSQTGFLSKPGSPKVTLNDKLMFYADAAFMAKKKAGKPSAPAASTPSAPAPVKSFDGVGDTAVEVHALNTGKFSVVVKDKDTGEAVPSVKIYPTQEWAESAAENIAAGKPGPKEGDTKPAADGGTLVLKDGHWVKQGEPAPTGNLSMPDFQEGKTVTGVKDLYEKVSQKLIDHAHAGNLSVLEDMPDPSKKMWQGKTANSKKLLALHAEAVASLKGSGVAGIDPAAKAPEPAPAASGAASKLAQIPWAQQMLPTSNSNAASHNKAVNKIKAMAEAGDVAGLQAFVDAKAGAKQTYAKKQGLLAQAALAALAADKPAAALTPAQEDALVTVLKLNFGQMPTVGDYADQWNSLSAEKKAELTAKAAAKPAEPVDKYPLVTEWKAAISAGKVPTKAQAEAYEALTEHDPDAAMEAFQDAVNSLIPPEHHNDDEKFDEALQDAHEKAHELHGKGLFGKGEKERGVKLAAWPSSTFILGKDGVWQKKSDSDNKLYKVGPELQAALYLHEGMAVPAALSGLLSVSQKASIIKQAAEDFGKSPMELQVLLDANAPKAAEPAGPAGVDVSGLGDAEKQMLYKLVGNNDLSGLEAASKYGAPPAYKKAAGEALAALQAAQKAKAQPAPVTADTPLGRKQLAALESLSLTDLDAIKDSEGLPPNVKAWINKKLAEAKKPEPPKTFAAVKTVFHNTQPGHNKSWSVYVAPNASGGHDVVTEYGKIGGTQQKTVKSFSTLDAAIAFKDVKVKSKKANGYSEKYTDYLHKVTLGGAVEQGPKEGDTKMGADGMLVLKDGHWVKMSEDKPAPKTIKKLTGAQIGEVIDKITPGKSAFSPNAHGKMAMKAALAGDGPAMAVAYSNAAQAMNLPKTASHIKAVAEAMGVDTSGWGGPKTPQSEPAPAAAPSASALPSADTWVKTGEQKGSNPGGKFKDPSGQEWYVKWPDDANAVKSEILAAKLYALAGLSSQDCMLVTKGGKTAIASKWVNIKKAGSTAALAKVEGVHEGFAVDAWLGNWDVIGLSLDNLQIGPDGKAHRVDAGGSLEYRAQGEKKPFGAKVEEIDTLRDAGKNEKAAAVFGKMTEADITASVAKVAAISDVAIRAMVNEHGPGDAEAKKKLADTLIARKQDLLKRFPKAAKAKKKHEFKPEKISAPPSFLNWGGSGKSGPSSKEFLNQANENAVQAIFAAAKTGDMDAVKNLTAPVFDKETGAVTGHKPVLEHPSQHVKGYAQQAINEINYQLNPPKRFRFDGGHPLHALNNAYPAHAGAASSSNAQKLGKFIVLGDPGTVKLDDMGLPAKIAHAEGGGTLNINTYAAAAKAAFSKMPATQKQAVQSYTGSSYHEMNGSLWSGNPTGAAKSAAEALKTLGHDIAPGTVLSRKISLHGSDLEMLLNAQGKILQEPAIMSTSIRPSSWSGNVHLKLHVGPGVKGLWVGKGSGPSGGAVSKHGGEDEMILPPNTRLLILSTKKSSGVDADGFGGSSSHVIEAVLLPSQ